MKTGILKIDQCKWKIDRLSLRSYEQVYLPFNTFIFKQDGQMNFIDDEMRDYELCTFFANGMQFAFAGQSHHCHV